MEFKLQFKTLDNGFSLSIEKKIELQFSGFTNAYFLILQHLNLTNFKNEVITLNSGEQIS